MVPPSDFPKILNENQLYLFIGIIIVGLIFLWLFFPPLGSQNQAPKNFSSTTDLQTFCIDKGMTWAGVDQSSWQNKTYALVACTKIADDHEVIQKTYAFEQTQSD